MLALLLGKFLKKIRYPLGKYYTKKSSAKGIQYVMLRIKDVCKLMISQAVGKRRSHAETKTSHGYQVVAGRHAVEMTILYRQSVVDRTTSRPLGETRICKITIAFSTTSLVE